MRHAVIRFKMLRRHSRIGGSCRWLVALLVGAVIAGGSLELEAAEKAGCEDGFDEADVVSLEQVWNEGQKGEAGYRAAEQMVAAAGAERREVDRLWFPEVVLESEGDVGKRVSPGAERDQGVSARAFTGASVTALFFDSARAWQREQRSRHLQQQEAASAVFDSEYRAQVARAYVEADFAAENLRRISEQRSVVDELARRVERRVDAGVEGDYQLRMLDEAKAQVERRFADAQQAQQVTAAELSALMDRCVMPASLTPDMEAVENFDKATDSPRVAYLRQQASASHAGAEFTRRQGQFQLRARGVIGAYFSPAYDQFPEPEYYGGLQGLWTPDFRGTRDLRGQSQKLQAQALEEEARSVQQTERLQSDRFEQYRQKVSERRMRSEEHLQRSESRSEAAVLRWRQGVGTWREVLDAGESLEQARLRHLELQFDMAMALIDYAELIGALDELPTWLGSAASR